MADKDEIARLTRAVNDVDKTLNRLVKFLERLVKIQEEFYKLSLKKETIEEENQNGQ